MNNTLIVDLNNLAIRCFFAKEVDGTSSDPQYNLWKYFIVENLINFVKRFKAKELILAVDHEHSWRKIPFPRYKESRKEQKEKSDVDWNALFENYEELQKAIKLYLPFKTIKTSRAEADDIIAILSKQISNNVIIISNDSDYLQLYDKNIKIFNPTKDEYMKLAEDKKDFITKLCLTGQSKDGIFNVLTPDDYPNDIRKPGLGVKKAEKILNEGIEDFLSKEQELKKGEEKDIETGKKTYKYCKKFLPKDNFERNQKLIDFNFIPKIIEKNVKKHYNNYEMPDINYIYSFFKQRNWRGILDEWDKNEKYLLNLY